MFRETSTSTYISSDEEVLMFRNPNCFPVVNKAWMHLGFRPQILPQPFISSPRDINTIPDISTKPTDEAYLSYVIARNLRNQLDLDQIQDTMRSIQQKHAKQIKLKAQCKKLLRLKVLSCLNR